MASPSGFPRSLLEEPWTARLAHFQRYTVAHPQLIEAKEKLLAAIQDAEPNSLVFVFGPTGVGKTTLRRKIEQILTEELRLELEQDRGRLAVVGVDPRSTRRHQVHRQPHPDRSRPLRHLRPAGVSEPERPVEPPQR